MGEYYHLRFFAPAEETKDKYGRVQTGYAPTHMFECKAKIDFLRGGEDVMSARLEGRQPVIAYIPRTVTSQQINTNYLMQDVRTGDQYNIRGIENNENHLHFDMLAEKGVAV